MVFIQNKSHQRAKKIISIFNLYINADLSKFNEKKYYRLEMRFELDTITCLNITQLCVTKNLDVLITSGSSFSLPRHRKTWHDTTILQSKDGGLWVWSSKSAWEFFFYADLLKANGQKLFIDISIIMKKKRHINITSFCK